MFAFKTITAICFGATLCTANTINISGVVQDFSGVGLVGVTVKLEKANLSATSGAGGVFTLTGSATSPKPRGPLGVMAEKPVQFRNGKITFTLTDNTSVGISVNDVGGRQVFYSRRTLGLGTHSVNVPLQAVGVYLCNITIGEESYPFKTYSSGAFSTQKSVVTSGTSTLAKQAKQTGVLNDVIAAASPGMLNYRCVIGNSDTSGVVIKMIQNAGNVTDIDGNVYQSVRIGNQVWMTENLRVTKYNDGSAIALDTSGSIKYDTTPTYFYYNNKINADSIKKYGALYNWHVVNSANSKKIAPTGWHVPSSDDWSVLIRYLVANGYNWDGTTTDNKIAKALAAKTDWYSYSAKGTVGKDLALNNSSGFSALPGGYRAFDGYFYSKSRFGAWWSSTGNGEVTSWHYYFYFEDQSLGSYYKGCGFSVRLLRD